jgi:hypothetical protein
MDLFCVLSGEFARAQARQAGNAALAASHRASKASDEVEFLRADIEKLMMISEALWGILKEKHGYTDSELVRRVEQVDMKDGKLDGKVAKSLPKKCPSCDRTIQGKRSRCLWCGQRVTSKPFKR